MSEAERVYAADGAADLCRAAGREADVIVGDFDSISTEAREGASDLRHRPDQNLTDADKVLAEIVADGGKMAAVCGLEGDLPDHELAALGSCLRSPLALRLLYRRGRAWLIRPLRWVDAEAVAGSRVSLIPLTLCTGVRLTGVRWTLDEAELSLERYVSISNQALGGTIEARVKTGAAWLFIGDA